MGNEERRLIVEYAEAVDNTDKVEMCIRDSTQALKEIRPEHPYKGYIVHPLDQLRNFFAGTDGCHIPVSYTHLRH